LHRAPFLSGVPVSCSASWSVRQKRHPKWPLMPLRILPSRMPTTSTGRDFRTSKKENAGQGKKKQNEGIQTKRERGEFFPCHRNRPWGEEEKNQNYLSRSTARGKSLTAEGSKGIKVEKMWRFVGVSLETRTHSRFLGGQWLYNVECKGGDEEKKRRD